MSSHWHWKKRVFFQLVKSQGIWFLVKNGNPELSLGGANETGLLLNTKFSNSSQIGGDREDGPCDVDQYKPP